jgi:hypothetical protein
MDNTKNMMQQIMEMLAKMQASQDAFQEKMAADRQEDKEESRETNQGLLKEMKEDLVTKMKEDRKADIEKMAAKQEDLLARMDEINAKMDATIQSIRSVVQETKHNRVENVGAEINQTMAAKTEKIPQGMMQSAEEHQDVVNEDVAVLPVQGLKQRHRGRKSTAERRGKQKNGNREKGIHMTRHDSPNGDKETTKKETGEVANRREMSEIRLKKGGCSRIH